MGKTYISTDNLCVGYSGRTVVDNVNIDVKRGEILALIGPNGAGKSTILKTLTRQLSKISGVVMLDDTELNKISVRDLATRMSVVLTERIEPELLTCKDVVAMGRYPYTDGFGRLTDEDERIVRESLESVNGLELADKSFDAISDGQRQRIMLARALCQQPDIMILDEPTSYLDIRYKVELLNILRDMANRGITIILSLHEIDLAYKLADRILCVNGKEMLMLGTPEEIFSGNTIEKLFGLEEGVYENRFGSIELKKSDNTPDVLVIGGSGSGIEVYRRLQKKGRAFYAGLLYENDCDIPVAKALATDVVAEKAFMPVSDENKNRMYKLLESVDYVIDCGCEHGEYDKINSEIIRLAESKGKLTDISSL